MFCFTETAEVSVHGREAEIQVGIWRFVILKPIELLHCYISRANIKRIFKNLNMCL